MAAPPNIDVDPATGSPVDDVAVVAAPPKNDREPVLEAPPNITSGLEGVFGKMVPADEAELDVSKICPVLLPENIEPVVLGEACPNPGLGEPSNGLRGGGLRIGFSKTLVAGGEEAAGVLGN